MAFSGIFSIISCSLVNAKRHCCRLKPQDSGIRELPNPRDEDGQHVLLKHGANVHAFNGAVRLVTVGPTRDQANTILGQHETFLHVCQCNRLAALYSSVGSSRPISLRVARC